MDKKMLEDALKKKAYLMGKSLAFARYEPRFPSDHTFCVFCWSRISQWEEDLHHGYVESESNDWICDICVEEYKTYFEWKIDSVNNLSWERLLKNNSLDIPLL